MTETQKEINEKFAEKYASREEEFQKRLQSVRDQMNEEREAFKMEIEKMKKEELENAKKEAAKFSNLGSSDNN